MVHQCGGSLIAIPDNEYGGKTNVIVTAAHCFCGLSQEVLELKLCPTLSKKSLENVKGDSPLAVISYSENNQNQNKRTNNRQRF